MVGVSADGRKQPSISLSYSLRFQLRSSSRQRVARGLSHCRVVQLSDREGLSETRVAGVNFA